MVMDDYEFKEEVMRKVDKQVVEQVLMHFKHFAIRYNLPYKELSKLQDTFIYNYVWRIAKLAFQPLTTQPYLWGVLGERLKHLAYQVCFESLCDSNGTCFPDNEHVVLSVCSASRFHVRCRILVQPQMLVSSGSLERPCSLEHWVLSVSLPPSSCLSVSVQNRGDFPQRTSHSACRCDHIRW